MKNLHQLNLLGVLPNQAANRKMKCRVICWGYRAEKSSYIFTWSFLKQVLLPAWVCCRDLRAGPALSRRSG